MRNPLWRITVRRKEVTVLTTQQLTYVIAVAECQSISKAAEKLYVTQPSLSQYIHGLEKQLGIKLEPTELTREEIATPALILQQVAAKA